MTSPPASAASATGSSRWRTVDWWYLGFLSMLVFQPTFDPDSGTFAWVVTGVTVAAFVPLYLHVCAYPGQWSSRYAPLLSAVLGVVVFPINSGATVLLVYAAAFVGGSRPRPIAFRWFMGLSLVAIALGVVAELPMPFALVALTTPIVFVWVVGFATLEEAARHQEAARLRVDNARIAHLSTATERERIARDLHDVTGHSLTSIIVRAQLVQRLTGADPERAAREAAEIEASARATLTEIRGTVAGWRQSGLDEEFAGARAAAAAAGIELEIDREPDLRLAPSVEQALGLAVREAITNVIRHARAKHCVMRLCRRGPELVLEVVDDGTGGRGPDGHGLRGMAERFAALGGRVERCSDAGTQLVVSVPVEVAG